MSAFHRERVERTQQIIRVLLKHMEPAQQKAAIEEIVVDPDIAAELIDAMGAGDAFIAIADVFKRTN